MVPRCQKCNADRRKVIIVRNGVGHVTDLELDVSGALSQCPSGDPAQQVQSSNKSLYFGPDFLCRDFIVCRFPVSSGLQKTLF